MTDLRLFKKTPELRPLTTDQVIETAESLGRVSVEDDRFLRSDSKHYKAEIRFTNSAGSHIFACGKGATIKDALVQAIGEAERLI